MQKLKSAWTWFRDHAIWILGILVAVIVAVLAIKYERNKVAKLQADVEISKVQADIVELAARRDAILDADKESAKKDLLLQKDIDKKTEEIEKVRKDAKKKDAEEIARRMNEIYKDKGLL